MVLLILAIVWAAVLLPPWLQKRSESRPADSITSFRNQLSVLERRSAPGSSHGAYAPVAMSAMTRSDARRRRRDVLFTLAGAASLTLALALVLGGPVLYVHLALDTMLAGYVLLLVRAQRLASERETKVRFLPAQQSPEPALLLRRSAN